MKAGDLRHTIQIQQRTLTPDGLGGGTPTWVTVTNGERKAAIVPVNSDVHFTEEQLQEIVTHKIWTRYTAGVTTDMRIRKKDDGRVFEIRSVIVPQERRRWLLLRAFERKAT